MSGYAYLAACCKRLGNKAEYMNNPKQACDKNPTEIKDCLLRGIPENDCSNSITDTKKNQTITFSSQTKRPTTLNSH